MQLLVYISNNADALPKILSGLMNEGVTGATVVKCEGMLRALASNPDFEMPAFFSRSRQKFNIDGESGKMVLAVMPDELVLTAENVIKDICGDFHQPDSGIMFSLPVMRFAGVTKNKQ